MIQRWSMLLKVSGIIMIGLLVLVLAGSTWDYSGKSEFCISCHTMETVTSSHSASAHAKVNCTDCHLGVGFSPTMLLKKASDVNQVVKNITGTYEKPIYIRHNVPVKKSCESCHYTEVFRREMVKVTESFNSDLNNTKNTMAILLKVGDGSKVEGIHWHVENSIVYGKDEDDKIVSIEVQKKNGDRGLYRDPDGGEPVKFKEMDCVDCHNRVAHRIEAPNAITDIYLLEGKLDPSLPYLKREVIGLLDKAHDEETSAWPSLFNSIVSFYEVEYPDVFQARAAEIEKLPEIIEEMAAQILFPMMNVSWKTYPDNLGHSGCFQCHSSKFNVVAENTSQGLPETISMDCQLCHSTPIIAQGDDKKLVIDLQ